MNISKKILGIILIVSFIFLTGSNYSSFVFSDDTNELIPCHATWKHHYRDFDSLIENSDLIIYGRVISQSTELRADLVFTNNYIQIIQNYTDPDSVIDECRILQTGGSYNNIYTPPIADAPLLSIGDESLFILEKTAESEIFGSYYLITGGYQGVFDVPYSLNEGMVLSTAESMFNAQQLLLQGFNHCNPENDIYGTTVSIRYWGTSAVYFYYSSSEVKYPSVISSRMQSWNSNGLIYYYYSSNSNSPVDIYDYNYGEQSWIAITRPYPTSSTSTTMTGADIRMNKYNYSDYFDNSTDYGLILCHEAGHALGFLRHWYTDVTSIMQESADDIIGSYSGPTSNDIYQIYYMYENIF